MKPAVTSRGGSLSKAMEDADNRVAVCISLVNIQMAAGLELIEDFADVVDAGSVRQPLGGAHGAQREASAVFGVVTNLERVVGARGSDDVFAAGVADAVRRDLDGCVGLRGLDDLLERDRSAGRRVELGLVMGFGDGKLIAFEFGQFASQAKELLHADREVGAVEQACLPADGERLHLVDMCVPAGGADDDAAAQRKDSADVGHGSFRGGEIDHDVDAGQRRPGDGGRVMVFPGVEYADAMAALARDLSYKRSGFSFAEDEQEHGDLSVRWLTCFAFLRAKS